MSKKEYKHTQQYNFYWNTVHEYKLIFIIQTERRRIGDAELTQTAASSALLVSISRLLKQHNSGNINEAIAQVDSPMQPSVSSSQGVIPTGVRTFYNKIYVWQVRFTDIIGFDRKAGILFKHYKNSTRQAGELQVHAVDQIVGVVREGRAAAAAPAPRRARAQHQQRRHRRQHAQPCNTRATLVSRAAHSHGACARADRASPMISSIMAAGGCSLSPSCSSEAR